MPDAARFLTPNRITICLTRRQRDYLLLGAARYDLGLSEYVRRLLDRMLDQDRDSTASVTINRS